MITDLSYILNLTFEFECITYKAYSDVGLKRYKMGIKSRRKNLKVGDSVGITYPYVVDTGTHSTLAGNRIFLVDPRGEISENDLLEFLETHVEPQFWPWYLEKKGDARACKQVRRFLNEAKKEMEE
jgi:hypothetical protein